MRGIGMQSDEDRARMAEGFRKRGEAGVKDETYQSLACVTSS
jgi:hypothetical protein